MKFNIITLGCKVNTYESEFMAEALKQKGYIQNEENPDIIIINTCSVTNMADSKSLKITRRMKRENPTSILVVAGCSSQNNQAKYQELGIDILIGNQAKSQIVTLIENYLLEHEKYSYFTNNRNLPFEDMTVKRFTTHTRAFIKIQDGCNNFCSYCIIPYTRGDIRSKDFNTILKEANTLVAHNHQELVLTGIHTGSYNNQGHDLSDLLLELVKIPKLARIRISSIEITELGPKFLEVLKNNPKICNHLHIPLQSGSDNILKRMNRKYDKDYYRQKIKIIRTLRPDISITTDCIVGHPYETDCDFAEYLDFCREIGFSKIHVFPYSKRNGTASSHMPEVEPEVKKNRAKELIRLSNELEQAYNQKFLNQTALVLTEEQQGEFTVGHTSNYLKVYLKGVYKLNNFYEVLLKEITNNGVYGEIITCSNTKISL